MSRGASPIRVRRARGASFAPQAGAFHRRKLWRMVAVSCIGVALGLTYVWQHIQTNLIGYRLREVELQNAQLRVDIARLETDVAELSAPARIDGYARRRLGMVRQGTWDLVMLEAADAVATREPSSSPSFWDVQQERWGRLAARLHATLGPGQAMAAPDPPRAAGKPDALR